MKYASSNIRCWQVPIACLLSMQLLIACGKTTGTESVSIHGVNYTGEEISYIVEDPANSNNSGGGEIVAPFAAGGTMCCYDLPKKWRSGIQIRVNVTRWLPKKADGSLPKVEETHMAEVPRYVDGKPGELWVLRNADGTIGVVSSDFQPDHEKWPGKVKGWPVPSLAYQRERWDLYIDLAESDLKADQELMTQFEKSPEKRATESWQILMQYRPEDLEGLSGPTDPRFRAKLKHDDEGRLKQSQLRLKQLRESRP